MVRWALTLIVILGIAGAGAGCTPAGSDADQLNVADVSASGPYCLPEGVFEHAAPMGPAAPSAAPDQVSIYFDVSLANIGYGAPELQHGYASLPYRNLVSALFALERGGMDVALNGFAAALEPISQDALVALARGEARCALSQASMCQRTNLSLPFEAINDRANGPSIIVSDMMFRDPDVFNPGPLSLSHTIRTVIASGQSVGLIGIKAPFRGALYDMPGEPSVWEDARRVDGRRVFSPVRYMPLFIMIIGSNSEIEYLRNHFARSVFEQQAVEHHFSLFSARARRLEPIIAQARAPGADLDFLSPSFFIQPSGVARDVLQLRLDRRRLREFHAEQVRQAGEHAPGEGPLEIRFPVDALLWPGARLGGDFEVEVEVFQSRTARTRQTCDDGWDRVMTSLPGSALGEARYDASAGEGLLRVYLDHEAWLEADSRFIHLARVSVRAQPDRASPAAPDWIEAWSFEADSIPSLRASPPEFFPVLNVAALARMLDREARESAIDEALAESAVYIEIR
ncbi:MAG: hypothetical protein JJU18_05745 [Oceanicaulis sp.]|nr:hypothetical protein [Oceanicaulis sp.]